MKMHFIYVIQIRMWPNIWEEKNNQKTHQNNIRIILAANIKKQIRKPSEGEFALHQNTPQYCICKGKM